MTRRLHSYRQGDLAEDLAGYVLSTFSVVTRVERQNDFGVDRICSLLRRDNRYLYVGSTFGVQLKTEGSKLRSFGGFDKKTGEWRKWDLEWLFEQDYPFLLGYQDRKRRRLRLYTTTRMWWVRWMRGWPFEVALVPKLNLELERLSAERYLSESVETTQGDARKWTVPLGGPIVDVSQEEIEGDERLQDTVRETINRWIKLERRNIFNYKLGVPYSLEYVTWTANEPPEPPAMEIPYANPSVNQNVREILGAIRPGVLSLAFNLLLQQQKSKLSDLKPLAALLRENGLESDQLEQWTDGYT